MQARLIGESKMAPKCECVSEWCVSCDGLVTCSGDLCMITSCPMPAGIGSGHPLLPVQE
uniref:Uncharacterized protein n=1 Tax=Anguilla anguilla TaxID=7936 RepID=A0A0E9VV19_ANGAN